MISGSRYTVYIVNTLRHRGKWLIEDGRHYLWNSANVSTSILFSTIQEKLMEFRCYQLYKLRYCVVVYVLPVMAATLERWYANIAQTRRIFHLDQLIDRTYEQYYPAIHIEVSTTCQAYMLAKWKLLLHVMCCIIELRVDTMSRTHTHTYIHILQVTSISPPQKSTLPCQCAIYWRLAQWTVRSVILKNYCGDGLTVTARWRAWSAQSGTFRLTHKHTTHVT